MLAVAVPSSFRRTNVPATAVYLSVRPLTMIVCSVLEDLSSILGGAAGAAASACGGPPRFPPLWAPMGSASAVSKIRLASFRICFDFTLSAQQAFFTLILREAMADRLAWRLMALGMGLLCLRPVLALDPHKALSQYSRTVWTQEHGLPQDTIRAITQTTDGYLWLGTDEGLARFDGYDFVVFDKDHYNLPTNSITALAAGLDGSLWIGTASGLTRYRDKAFYTYTIKDGLPDNSIADLTVDHQGVLWVVSGVDLARFDGKSFTVYKAGRDIPVTTRSEERRV